MGVQGLTPFLLRQCPEVIHTLKERFQGLKGTRIVIDGTLVTQRLHFAPTPHPHRHVIGWYRILRELQASEISVICVFDGKERVAAKRMERNRRHQALQLVNIRGDLERNRLERVEKITATIAARIGAEAHAHQSSLSEAPEGERRKFVASLSSALLIISKGEHIPAPSIRSDFEDTSKGTASPRKPYEPLATEQAYGGFEEADISEVLFDRDTISVSPLKSTGNEAVASIVVSSVDTTTSSIEDTAEPLPNLDLDVGAEPTIQAVISTVVVADPSPGVLVDAEDEPGDHALGHPGNDLREEAKDDIDDTGPIPSVRMELSDLRTEFQESLRQLKALPEQTSSNPDDEADVDVRTDLLMSKIQAQLTEDESRFWDQLSETSPRDDDLRAANKLVERSKVLLESYERRKNIPTSSTYEESKEIIRAMGVPCIEPSGPYEAEAVASSLVLKGLADYVASEDTDTLVYGAPLIRNVTSRETPLALIPGADIPQALGFSRQQFIDFCILLGTDFSKRIKNIGPIRAFKFIQKYGTIEAVLENDTKYTPHGTLSEYLWQVEQARSIFKFLPPVPTAKLVEQEEMESKKVDAVLQKYGFPPGDASWDYAAALAGNYFGDNPFCT